METTTSFFASCAIKANETAAFQKYTRRTQGCRGHTLGVFWVSGAVHGNDNEDGMVTQTSLCWASRRGLKTMDAVLTGQPRKMCKNFLSLRSLRAGSDTVMYVMSFSTRPEWMISNGDTSLSLMMMAMSRRHSVSSFCKHKSPWIPTRPTTLQHCLHFV